MGTKTGSYAQKDIYVNTAECVHSKFRDSVGIYGDIDSSEKLVVNNVSKSGLMNVKYKIKNAGEGGSSILDTMFRACNINDFGSYISIVYKHSFLEKDSSNNSKEVYSVSEGYSSVSAAYSDDDGEIRLSALPTKTYNTYFFVEKSKSLYVSFSTSGTYYRIANFGGSPDYNFEIESIYVY